MTGTVQHDNLHLYQIVLRLITAKLPTSWIEKIDTGSWQPQEEVDSTTYKYFSHPMRNSPEFYANRYATQQ